MTTSIDDSESFLDELAINVNVCQNHAPKFMGYDEYSEKKIK